MKPKLEGILAGIRNGTGPSLFLLHGDDFHVHNATRAILDLLAPSAQRSLHLERFDGRTTEWDQIEAALKTPPLLTDKKTVFIENAPYFLSPARKGEMAEKVLRLWGEGRQQEAAGLFLDLLVLEGWTPQRWEKAKKQPSGAQFRRLFSRGDMEETGEPDSIFAFCCSQGLELNRHPTEERHGPGEFMETGPPPWAILLMTAVQVDRRGRLYRKLEADGAVLDLDLERDRDGRIKRQPLAEMLDRRLREAGKKIEPRAREMVLARAGNELWAFHEELEKLVLYAGEEPWVRVRDVEEVFSDQAESWVFELTGLMAQRDTLGALACLGRLLAHGEHPLRLLGFITAEVRRLLTTRHLIEGEMRGRWNRDMTYPQFQKSVLGQGGPIVTRNPYGDYRSFQRAEQFTTRELLRDLELTFRTDVRLKSSGNYPPMIMERLVMEMCQG